MVDNPGTSLHYMCIVQTSSVSTAACIDHQVFMFHFWTKWIILQHLLVYFLIKRTEQLISPIKNLRANVFLTCYRCFRSTSLDSFVYDYIVKKDIQKRFHSPLTTTCINKDIFICVNKLLNARARIGDYYHLCVDTNRLIWNWWWMKKNFLTKK